MLHVLALWNKVSMGEWEPLFYFHKIGSNDQGEWNHPPPHIVDTVFDGAYDVACSNTDGKVALVWLANLPDPGDCDTCSNSTGGPYPDRDNDLYYQISFDYGVTFQPCVNVTQNVDGQAGYRPYTDVSALIDTENDLHIAWGARVWPADANSGGEVDLTRGRIFHWGENLSPGNIRTAANLEWDQTDCDGGAWQLNGSKMSLSECNGFLYCLWTQFNDPAHLMDDCAQRAWGGGGGRTGAANGELYVALSDNGGLTWTPSLNLTNTQTPHCDSATGVGGRCASEHWASMARFGTNLVGTDMSQAYLVDPTGYYTDDYYLDVMYIDDPNPGAAVLGEGSMQQADVRWFRLACVDPSEFNICCPSPGLTEIDWPTWTKHGTPLDIPWTVHNYQHGDISITVTPEEDNGPAGWLALSSEFQAPFVIPSGEENSVSGTITLNAGGVVNAPGTIVHLRGRIVMDHNGTTSPDTMPIQFWVADTLYLPTYDTITTGRLALVVGSSGNYGKQGAGEVNMDFFNYGDCDNADPGTEGDTIPGDATVYLYDASPVICWPDGDSVICNWSIFGQGYLSDNGFTPMGHEEPVDSGAFVFNEYRFVTHDTGILVTRTWIVPQPASDSCNFLVQASEYRSADGQAHSGLNIGEIMDWDIPSDTASRNRSGIYPSRRLIYQQGSEYGDDDAIECQDNSDRYGGIALLEIIEIDSSDTVCGVEFYGAYSADNPTYVYPAGGFVPSELNSMMTTNAGYYASDSIDEDLHLVQTVRSNYNLTPERTLLVFSCLISSRLGFADFIAEVESCHQWYAGWKTPVPARCCLGFSVPFGRGNVNYDAGDFVDISDLVYLVDYMFTGGPSPACWSEANVDGSNTGPDGFPDTPDDIDISDLVYLVDYMFTGGPPPKACPGGSGYGCNGLWQLL